VRIEIWIGWALVQHGATLRYERARPSADPSPFPMGDGHPPIEYWWGRYCRAGSDAERDRVEELANEALCAWRRRPDPPPEGETVEQWVDRIIKEGEGWSAADVALAERCTPRMVRRWRMERERNPETGRVEGSLQHARELRAQGLTLRQVAMMTGIPKSTLHDLDRAA
jgi:hypothetical protein